MIYDLLLIKFCDNYDTEVYIYLWKNFKCIKISQNRIWYIKRNKIFKVKYYNIFKISYVIKNFYSHKHPQLFLYFI